MTGLGSQTRKVTREEDEESMVDERRGFGRMGTGKGLELNEERRNF